VCARAAPGLGAELPKDHWVVGAGYRFFRSHRHFTGATEDVNRAEDDSEVVNNFQGIDLSAQYGLSARVSLVAGLPIVAYTRSTPIRDTTGTVIARYLNHSSGIGDVYAGVRAWVLDPTLGPKLNLNVGLGIKLPTGNDAVVDTRARYNATTGGTDLSIATVDQSIQPGDGGVGALLFITGYWNVLDSVRAYFDGTYLSNPADTNGVYTYRTRASEAIMSVADQYLLRLGAVWSLPWVNGLNLGLGGRLEGVPVRDLIGASDGFRRPGFAISLDPGISYTLRGYTFSLNVPVMLYRERQVSVPDIQDGAHGDAAFADYMVSAGITRAF
jgi:hypothetical protein